MRVKRIPTEINHVDRVLDGVQGSVRQPARLRALRTGQENSSWDELPKLLKLQKSFHDHLTSKMAIWPPEMESGTAMRWLLTQKPSHSPGVVRLRLRRFVMCVSRCITAPWMWRNLDVGPEWQKILDDNSDSCWKLRSGDERGGYARTQQAVDGLGALAWTGEEAWGETWGGRRRAGGGWAAAGGSQRTAGDRATTCCILRLRRAIMGEFRLSSWWRLTCAFTSLLPPVVSSFFAGVSFAGGVFVLGRLSGLRLTFPTWGQSRRTFELFILWLQGKQEVELTYLFIPPLPPLLCRHGWSCACCIWVKVFMKLLAWMLEDAHVPFNTPKEVCPERHILKAWIFYRTLRGTW